MTTETISSTMNGQFDLRIILKFDGTGAVIDLIEKQELVCGLSGVKQLDWVIPLHLTGREFVVYQQLTKDEKSDAALIKEALITAFAADSFMAYEKFDVCVLCPGETIDVYGRYMEVVGPFQRNPRPCNGMCVCAGASWPHEEALMVLL